MHPRISPIVFSADSIFRIGCCVKTATTRIVGRGRVLHQPGDLLWVKQGRYGAARDCFLVLRVLAVSEPRSLGTCIQDPEFLRAEGCYTVAPDFKDPTSPSCGFLETVTEEAARCFAGIWEELHGSLGRSRSVMVQTVYFERLWNAPLRVALKRIGSRYARHVPMAGARYMRIQYRQVRQGSRFVWMWQPLGALGGQRGADERTVSQSDTVSPPNTAGEAPNHRQDAPGCASVRQAPSTTRPAGTRRSAAVA